MANRSLYGPDTDKQARKLCLLGATNAELADFFEVTVLTIINWQKSHASFADAVKAGKDQADAEVAHKLYRRALGYSHKAVKILVVDKEVIHEEYTEHYAPDTTACIFWLKNRQRKWWRDRPDDDGPPPPVDVKGGLPE